MIPIDPKIEKILLEDSDGFKIPARSDWQCQLFKNDDVVYTPPCGGEPNWFHRQMHRLLLGFRWRKV